MSGLDRTHDPNRRSWVVGADAPETDFPIQNLPLGVFGEARHVGVAIGEMILDVTVLEEAGLLQVADRQVFDQGVLNPFMALGSPTWSAVRHRLSDLLDADTAVLRDDRVLRDRALARRAGTPLRLPWKVAGFTDFYASREHATNVGRLFRGADNALMPNWLHVPIGYNGRASTVVVSGTAVRRPMGQVKEPDNPLPRFAPSARLDFELELGAVVGTPSHMGERLSAAEAWDALFGFVLLNDWSARDIQVWEYQPLGPFQSKAFATSVSPWVVTKDALEPFRVATPERVLPLLPYLDESSPNNLDITLEVDLAPGGDDATTIARTNARGLYYSSAQQLAHHASSGCAMETGDLIGSGTVSGPTPGSEGSLLELTENGRRPLALPGGASRAFLEDGDRVTLRGWCARDGARRIGFGACDGVILPANGSSARDR